MTRYEELCSAFSKGYQDYLDYRDLCADAAANFYSAFKEYLQPACKLLLLTNDTEKGGPNTRSLPPLKAISLGKDGYSRFVLAFTLWEDPKGWPQDFLGVEFAMKKPTPESSFFEILLGKETTIYKVPAKEPKLDDYIPIFERIFTHTKDRYEKTLQQYLTPVEERVLVFSERMENRGKPSK